MYKNPLNNGDLSDYNSLKNQRDYGAIIKRYEKVKLETKPSELQKYYQFLTYKQPILDELNYVSERLKTEDIKKQNENFEFIEKLKNKNETKLKDLSKKEKDLSNEIKIDLFDNPINKDLTPTINTDLEIELPEEYNKVMLDLIKKQEIQLLTPSIRKKEGYSRLNLEQMKRRSERNKLIKNTIEAISEKPIQELFKEEKILESNDQKENLLEALIYEEEKAKVGRALGQPNEATIQKYNDWRSGKSKDRPKKKQIIAVEAWLKKTNVPVVQENVLIGVPLENEQVSKKKSKGKKKK